MEDYSEYSYVLYISNMKLVQTSGIFRTLPILDFHSRNTFLDYEGLIIDLESVRINSAQVNSDFYTWRYQTLSEFMRYRQLPIVFINPKQSRLNIKGTPTDYSEILPVPVIDIVPEEGSGTSVSPQTFLTEFFKKYKDSFLYTHFFRKHAGTTSLTTSFTNKTLSFYTKTAVFLPRVSSLISEEKERLLLENLFHSIRNISSEIEKDELPEWTNKYLVPDEEEVKTKITSLSVKITDLSKELQESHKKANELIEKKRLLTATGNELEEQVELLMRELGLEILEAERNRDDLIIKFKDRIAIVEIKGVTGSAAEKHAAQLEKWRTLYYEKYNEHPKGILLVNTYKDQPLHERKEADFPNQMLKYSENREHCLITTTQLLTMYYKIQEKPETKETEINSLFATIGRFNPDYKWSDHIKIE